MTARGPDLFLSRELSWLEFNRRVLEEAQDSKNPLLERLRFYGIFHSNLDEFFMVRAASLLRRIEEGDHKPDPAGMTPQEQLDQVLLRVRDLQEVSCSLYEEKLRPALAKEQIRILSSEELTPAQEEYLDGYFDREIYPILTPVAVDRAHSFPHLSGLAVNLAVLVSLDSDPEAPARLAVVPVPAPIPALCHLPGAGVLEVCWLSDIIRRRISRLFSGYRVLEAACFRLTRDAEMELDDESPEDFLQTVQSGLRQRQRGKPVRLEYDLRMTTELRERLRSSLDMAEQALMPIRGPLDPKPLLQLVDLAGFDKLRYRPQPPLLPAILEQQRSIFDLIREGDILFHHPYDSFETIAGFIQAAAEDPDVLAIKQVLYRTSGRNSPLVRALVRAAEQGKQVTVLLELTARFDEERNISWARGLEDAGVQVLYGVARLKVHAKIALVVRREPDAIRRYVHLGTGNYNERTARLYTDFGLLTAVESFGTDASAFFNTITGYSEPPMFNHLIMAPLGLREKIISLIRREADWARSGQVSGIMAKINSLVDPHIIRELYAASEAGVPIQLNVRGICCLRPGVPKLSEKIRVVSIVDRYLEHSRALVVRNGGNSEVYVSSADWMPRNLDRRVELMYPILQEGPKRRVIEVLEAQFADNQKARLLKPDGTYERVGAGRSEPLRVQEYLYRRAAEDRERLRSVTPVRFVPLEGGK